jgi:hypothetical protein
MKILLFRNWTVASLYSNDFLIKPAPCRQHAHYSKLTWRIDENILLVLFPSHFFVIVKNPKSQELKEDFW